MDADTITVTVTEEHLERAIAAVANRGEPCQRRSAVCLFAQVAMDVLGPGSGGGVNGIWPKEDWYGGGYELSGDTDQMYRLRQRFLVEAFDAKRYDDVRSTLPQTFTFVRRTP